MNEQLKAFEISEAFISRHAENIVKNFEKKQKCFHSLFSKLIMFTKYH